LAGVNVAPPRRIRGPVEQENDMNRFAGAVVAGFCWALVAGSGIAGESPSIKTVLASVDGTDITVGHVIAFRGRLPQQYQDLPDDVLLQGIVEQLIQQTVLMNAIRRQLDTRTALGLENERRSFLASEMLARVSERAITEEELKTAYQERYDSAVPDQEFDASHILVKTREEADEIVVLLQGGADFATVARERSTGPSGPNGGALGWFGKGDMVPPFEAAVLTLAVGEVSTPVETQFGWHVVRLNDMRDVKIPTLDDIRPNLTMELQQRAVEAEIARLTAEADVVRAEVDVDPAIIRDVSLFAD